MQKTAGWAFPAQLLWKGFCSFEMKGKKKKKKKTQTLFLKNHQRFISPSLAAPKSILERVAWHMALLALEGPLCSWNLLGLLCAKEACLSCGPWSFWFLLA
jgi:hypothetical protein